MTRRIVFALIGVVVVAAAVTVGLVVTRVDRLVADAVETYGGAATGTAVSVGAVEVELAKGRASLSDLEIGNPQGFTSDYSVLIRNVDATIDLRSLASGVPVVTELRLDDALINAEHAGDTTNLSEIQRYASTPRRDPGGNNGAEPRIIIERFRLTNARVTVTSEFSGKEEELELEDVTVNGIGRGSGGVTYGEAAGLMLNPILAEARSAAGRRLQREAIETVTEELRERIEEEAGASLEELLDR